jgi:branched-chain amino acid transport system permease protein
VVGSYTAHHQIVIGLLFIVVVIVLPRGLVGYAAPALDRWLARAKDRGGRS